LLEIKKTLTAAGFWVSEIIDHGFIYSIYSFDPNNIPVEFSYNVPDVDIRKKPKMKDKHPSVVTLEGSEPQPGSWPALPDAAEAEEDLVIYPGEGRIISENE